MRERSTRIDAVSALLLDDQKAEEDEFDVDGAGLDAQSTPPFAFECAVHWSGRKEACDLFRRVDARQLGTIVLVCD